MRTDPLTKDVLPGRRDFLKTGSMATAATVLGASASGAPSAPDKTPRAVGPYPMIEKNDVILFQGDSITDAGRSREESDSPNNVGGMGRGYAALIAWQLLAERAGEGLKCHNRGVSGNKVPQLAARWQEDCIDLKPNVLSILIGVNDIWHKLGGNYDGTSEVYQKGYLDLIERTRRDLPQVKLVICEPFVLRCGAVDEKWFPEFDGYRAAAKKVAETFRAAFVPFQSAFDKATRKASPEYWAGDGVHPTMAGCHLMAQTWLRTVNAAKVKGGGAVR